jgi:hypothetical protein
MARRDLTGLADFNSDLDDLKQGEGFDALIQPNQSEIAVGTDTELSTDESLELERCEAIIERGLKTFFEVGSALLRVRDLRLYRVDHPTFEAYCQERWDFSKTYANNLIAATSVRNNLTTMVVTELPENERQARPLAHLEPDQQRQVWQATLQRAQALGKRITAALVEAVVKELQPPETPVELATRSPRKSHSAVQNEAEEHTFEPTSETLQSPAQRFTEQMPMDVDDDDLDDEEEPERRGEWPDDLEDMQATLHRRGYVLVKETEARLSYQRDSDQSVVTVAKPPEPGKLKVRVVAHRDDDWQDVADHLALAGVELDSPRAGHLPKYPETQRAYGTLDLNTDQLDQVSELQAKLVQAEQQIEQWKQRNTQMLEILHEYQEHVTRAQKYKPTSDKGEAVSPFLRLVERIWLELQEEARKQQ